MHKIGISFREAILASENKVNALMTEEYVISNHSPCPVKLFLQTLSPILLKFYSVCVVFVGIIWQQHYNIF